MSAKTIKEFVDNGPYVLKNNKFNSNVENHAEEKDIAVENVIRRLKQKKSIEVKKVNDMDSKLKQISPLLEKKTEVAESYQSLSSIINLNPFQNDDSKAVVTEQKIYNKITSAKTTNYLEIEDDEIEDYLEIDQNVVEDLEALIPEEEIVSISNSLIQPENQLLPKSENPAILDAKQEGTEISEPVLICDLNQSEDPKHKRKSQDIEIKHDEEIENKVDMGEEDLVVTDSPSKGEMESEKKNCNKMINNNEPDTKITNLKTSEITGVEIQNSIISNHNNNNNKASSTKQDPRNHKRLKMNSNTSGANSRKITDFFIPSATKMTDSEEQKSKITDISPNKNFQDDMTNLSSEIINVDKEELSINKRTLRSRSKLPLNESKTKESQFIDQILNCGIKEQTANVVTSAVQMEIVNTNTTNELIDSSINLHSTELKNETLVSVSKEIESSEKTINQIENKTFNEVSNCLELVKTCRERRQQSQSEPSEIISIRDTFTRKYQPKRKSKKSSINILSECEEKNDILKDEGQKLLEGMISNNLQENNVIENNQKEEIIVPKSLIESELKNSNENPMFAENTLEENQDVPIENQHINKITKKRRITNQRKTTKVENNSQNITSDDVEAKQSMKRKRQTRNRNQNKNSKQKKVVEGLGTSPIETLQKNKETKLKIYDFDDKSNEEIEELQKSAKKKKLHVSEIIQLENQTVTPTEEESSNMSVNNSKKLVEPEIINNNRLNNIPENIESSVESSDNKSGFEVGEDKPELKDVDCNSSTSSNTPSKATVETGKLSNEFSQNWKPVYGPYKRIDRCNVCLLSFKSYKKLRAHKKIHEVDNPYKCQKCDESFEDVEMLAAHLRIHKGKMPFACKKCDATFWTSFQLDKHQLVHVLKKGPAPTKPPSKVFKCEECGKEFKKICDLERHTRVHTGEKPSVCNICNKRFQQAYNLNKHLYTHTQEKNYECVICQKKFGRNDVLNRHVLTHSIIKPFRCSICSRTFIRNSQLKLHLRKHHDLDEDPGNSSSTVDEPVPGTSATTS